MRKPTIVNKYNLTMTKVKKLKVADRSKIKQPLFWRNDVISAWCILKRIGDNDFWIGIYDEDAQSYKGEFRVEFTTLDGMCTYEFGKFYNSRYIQNEHDLRIQEMALETINFLLDEAILI